MKLKLKRRIVSLVLPGLVAFTVNAQPELQMTEVLIEESEPGLEPYLSRYLLNEQYLRLDDGTDQGDFILFDRKTREIHSFNHEDGTHLLIKPNKNTPLNLKVDYQVRKNSMHGSPKIGGVSPIEYQFFADSKKCKQSVNVKGFLPDMTQALINYEQVLVEQTKSTLSRFPASIRTACYMANNYLHASDYLHGGFPLQVVDDNGRQKRLISFQQVSKPQSIVKFPEGYHVYYPN